MKMGFPEKAMERMAKTLLDQGFKVAVIEQTETPKEMNKRLKNSSYVNRTMMRELVEILTIGTYSSALCEREIYAKYFMESLGFL